MHILALRLEQLPHDVHALVHGRLEKVVTRVAHAGRDAHQQVLLCEEVEQLVHGADHTHEPIGVVQIKL